MSLFSGEPSYHRLPSERPSCIGRWLRRRAASDNSDDDEDDVAATIARMRQFLLKITPKLNEMKRRADNADLAARQYLRMGDRNRARQRAVLRARFMRIRDRWVGFESAIEHAIVTYEEAVLAKAVTDVLGESQSAVQKLLETITEEKIVKLMDALSEQERDVSDRSEALAESLDTYLDGDPEIEAELDRLEEELAQEVQDRLPTLNNNNVEEAHSDKRESDDKTRVRVKNEKRRDRKKVVA